MPTDSLNKRYFSKLSSNLVRLVTSFATNMIIPRALGPGNYGDFCFLTDFFNKIVGFLDMGTSVAFYTKLSQRKNEFGLVSFYLYFSGIIWFVLFSFVICIHLTATYKYILPDQKIFYIYLACFMGILSWVVTVLRKMVDAYGVTVAGEMAKIVQNGLGLSAIFLLFILHQLSLANLFYYHYLILLFLAAAFIWIMDRKKFTLIQSWKLSLAQVRKYIREFYSYSHPLFIVSFMGLLLGILDRWLLQYFGGSIQQGFYGISYRIGTICFLFTSALTPLLMREFSIAFEANEPQEIGRLFRRYVPVVYSIAAYFSCFIAVQADSVAYIIGGSRFAAASKTVMIMAFFPINQTLGQLVNSVYYATGQTRLYRNISIFFGIIALPIIWFLVAPKEKMGLNLGATGLAIKLVSLQFISVNVRLFFTAKYLKIEFRKYVARQFGAVITFLGLAYIARYGIRSVFETPGNVLLNFICSGIIYSVCAVGLLIVFPGFWGLSADDIRAVKRIVFYRRKG